MTASEKIKSAAEEAGEEVLNVFEENELTNEEASFALDKIFDMVRIGISKSRNNARFSIQRTAGGGK